MLINDKSQLKRNVERIDVQLALKLARVSADLTDARHTTHIHHRKLYITPLRGWSKIRLHDIDH